MEASIRAMSWSRYRCLSWFFVRLRTRLRRRGVGSHKRLQIFRDGLSVLRMGGYTGCRAFVPLPKQRIQEVPRAQSRIGRASAVTVIREFWRGRAKVEAGSGLPIARRASCRPQRLC
jgi:hypothetical protein